jgi:hypothetical protein
MDAVPCVVVFGKDPLLLQTRRLVLSRGGFNVAAIADLGEFTKFDVDAIRVLVLCHTLTPKDQQTAIAVGQRANRGMKTIVMTAYLPEFNLDGADRFLSPFEGPETLIVSVREAMKEQDGSGSIHPREEMIQMASRMAQ